MKHFILSLLFLVTGVLTPAYANLVPRIVEGNVFPELYSGPNFIKNGHYNTNVLGTVAYADAAGVAPVDGTGGSPALTCTRTTSSPIEKSGSLLITKDAANRQGNGCGIAFSIDDGDKGTPQTIVLKSAVASGTYDSGTSSANSDLLIYVYDVTNAALLYTNSTRLVAGADTRIGFIASPTSTSYRLIVHQALTGTSAYALKVDSIKVGPTDWSIARFENTYTAKVDIAGTVTDETNGDWINGACGVTATSTYTCNFNASIFSSAPTCVWTPVVSSTDGKFGNINSTSTSSVVIRTVSQANGAQAVAFNLICFRTGTDNIAQAISPALVGQSWSGYHDASCLWNRTNAAFGDPTADATCTLVETSNKNFGTVTSVAGLLPGITFPSVIGAKYHVCAVGTASGATVTAGVGLLLTDTVTGIVDQVQNVAVSNSATAYPLCGYYTATTTSTTLRIYTKASSGQMALGGTAGVALAWTILKVSENIPAPVIIGGNASRYNGGVTSDVARVNCDSSSSITLDPSGMISSVGNISAGNCAVTLNSAFCPATALTPVCEAGWDSAGPATIVYGAATSNTNVNVGGTTDAGLASTIVNAWLRCTCYR